MKLEVQTYGLLAKKKEATVVQIGKDKPGTEPENLRMSDEALGAKLKSLRLRFLMLESPIFNGYSN